MNLLPAAGFGLSKVGLGKVGVVESLGKAEPVLLDDLGKISSLVKRGGVYNIHCIYDDSVQIKKIVTS